MSRELVAPVREVGLYLRAMRFTFSAEGTVEAVEDAFRAQVRATEDVATRMAAEAAFVHARAEMLDTRGRDLRRTFTLVLDLAVGWQPE